jgi:hypothetical protein
MATDRFRELAQSSNPRLEKIMRASKGPALESLMGFEHGCNTSYIKLLGSSSSSKASSERAERGGHNIPVRKNGLDAPALTSQLRSQNDSILLGDSGDREFREPIPGSAEFAPAAGIHMRYYQITLSSRIWPT